MLYTNLARKKHKVSIATETFHKALERDLAEKKKKKKKLTAFGLVRRVYE
jgi:hypothetical protein